MTRPGILLAAVLIAAPSLAAAEVCVQPLPVPTRAFRPTVPTRPPSEPPCNTTRRGCNRAQVEQYNASVEAFNVAIRNYNNNAQAWSFSLNNYVRSVNAYVQCEIEDMNAQLQDH